MGKCELCGIRLNEDDANCCETCYAEEVAEAQLASAVLKILTPYLIESRWGIPASLKRR